MMVSHFRHLLPLSLSLLCGCLAASPWVNNDSEPLIKLRMGVVLTKGSTGISGVVDYSILGPAIDLALQNVRRDFSMVIEPVIGLYPGNCVEDALDGLNQTVRVLEQGVDFLLGPACTGDLVVAAKLTTVYRVPLMTGRGQSGGQYGGVAVCHATRLQHHDTVEVFPLDLPAVQLEECGGVLRGGLEQHPHA